MPPFQELFASQEFWTSIILALIGGGGVGGLVGAWSNRRKTEADIDGITADAADKAVKILTQTRCRSRSPIRRSRSGIWSGCSTSISRRWGTRAACSTGCRISASWSNRISSSGIPSRRCRMSCARTSRPKPCPPPIANQRSGTMTTINLSVKRPKADGSLDPVRGSAEFSPVRRRFDAPACSRSSCATSRHGTRP